MTLSGALLVLVLVLWLVHFPCGTLLSCLLKGQSLIKWLSLPHLKQAFSLITLMSQFSMDSGLEFTPKSNVLIFCFWSLWMAWPISLLGFYLIRSYFVFDMRVLYSLNEIGGQNLTCTIGGFNAICMFCHVSKFGNICIHWQVQLL